MLELYYFHGATCGLKTRFALSEKKVKYTHRVLEREDLKKKEYLRLNPNAVVPTLVHNGIVLLESSIIMNYVDDAFDGPHLKPTDPLDIANMSKWMKKADDVYLPALGTTTYTVSMRDKILQKSEQDILEYLEAIPDEIRRTRRKKTIEMGFESPDFAAAIHTLDVMLSEMENALNVSEWLSGTSFSLADIAITPFIERLSELSFKGLWTESRPAVTDW